MTNFLLGDYDGVSTHILLSHLKVFLGYSLLKKMVVIRGTVLCCPSVVLGGNFGVFGLGFPILAAQDA